MKILVIGSNSFSGSNLVKNLLEEGFDVIGVSRSKEYNSAFLPYKNHKKLKNFRFYNYDINNNIQDISKLIKKERINNIFSIIQIIFLSLQFVPLRLATTRPSLSTHPKPS